MKFGKKKEDLAKPNPASYREKYYLFYVTDEGDVGKVETSQGFLKSIEN